MSQPPPLPLTDAKPPPIPFPPPVPTHVSKEKTPADYLRHASILCFALSGVMALGVLFIAFESLAGQKNEWTKVIIASCYMLLTLLAGLMLHRRKRFGDLLAVACFILILPGIPVGTVLGILGISWVRKGHSLLR